MRFLDVILGRFAGATPGRSPATATPPATNDARPKGESHERDSAALDESLREQESEPSQMNFEISYGDHWQHIRKQLAASVFAQPSRLEETAFFEACGIVVWQLAILELMLERQKIPVAGLRSAVRQPFALGYVFGAAAASIERHVPDRKSPASTSVIATLLQIVLGGGSLEECFAIGDAAALHPDYEAGMTKAAGDEDYFASGKGQPNSLFTWLAPTIGLTYVS